jgi:hypothetical protein
MTDPLRLVLESIDDHRNPAFSQGLKLLRRSFPESQRTDHASCVELLLEKRLGLLRPNNYHFVVARRAGTVLGVAIGSYLAVVNLGFVEYLAAAPEVKGGRVGTILRQRLLQELRRDARAAGNKDLLGLLGEVDAGSRWLRHLVRRRNVLPLDFDYYQPPLRGRGKGLPLVLYLEPVGAVIRRLPVQTVRAILYAIYRRVYRVRYPLREVAFRRMLKQLESIPFVGARSFKPRALLPAATLYEAGPPAAAKLARRMSTNVISCVMRKSFDSPFSC